jgi:endonuclease/exonuclease/phosphatase family metal-dependent hydrolase
LEHRDEAVRVQTASVIASLASDGAIPLFAIGDFNSSPVGSPSSVVDSTGRNAMTVLMDNGLFVTYPGNSVGFAAAKGEQGFSAAQYTFPSQDPQRIIDWILIPPNWAFVSHELLPAAYSDHRPVIAEVVFLLAQPSAN